MVRQWAAISFGEGHAAGVSGEGEVFTWGKNDLGQVGQNVGHDKDVPTKMEILKGWDVRALACGAHHTVALTPEDVISWGANSEGQCGQGERAETLWVKPRSIKPLQGLYVSQVVCGKYHTLCVTATSQVWSEPDLPASIPTDHKNANLQQTALPDIQRCCLLCMSHAFLCHQTVTQDYSAKLTAVVLAPPLSGQIGKWQNSLLETHL